MVAWYRKNKHAIARPRMHACMHAHTHTHTHSTTRALQSRVYVHRLRSEVQYQCGKLQIPTANSPCWTFLGEGLTKCQGNICNCRADKSDFDRFSFSDPTFKMVIPKSIAIFPDPRQMTVPNVMLITLKPVQSCIILQSLITHQLFKLNVQLKHFWDLLSRNQIWTLCCPRGTYTLSFKLIAVHCW